MSLDATDRKRLRVAKATVQAGEIDEEAGQELSPVDQEELAVARLLMAKYKAGWAEIRRHRHGRA